jgi:hypothetical protein
MDNYEPVSAEAVRLNAVVREADRGIRSVKNIMPEFYSTATHLSDLDMLDRLGDRGARRQAQILRENLANYHREEDGHNARRTGALALLKTHYEEHPDVYMQMAREVAAREGFTQFVDDVVATEVRLDS